MPNLELSEEREQFQKLAREFAEGEIAPLAEELDKTAEYPAEVIKKAWEIGLVNFQIPENLGGLELKVLDSCVILEELAAGCSGISAGIEGSAIAQLALLKHGTEEQKARFLEPLLNDCSLAGYASQDATEDDIEASEQSGSFVLNGHHTALVNGGHAAWYFVVASQTRESGDFASTAFIVPADSPGLVLGDTKSSFGRRARQVTSVSFENVKLTEENVLGEAGAASAIIHSILPQLYCFIASGAVGVAGRALHHAINYSKERQTFGRPISQHQGIAFMLAEMARELEAARYLTWQAAYLLDEGKRAFREAMVAKSYAQEAAMRITTDAVQIYGGYGYSKEYPVEKLMRDSKILTIFEGTTQIQKNEIAAYAIKEAAQKK